MCYFVTVGVATSHGASARARFGPPHFATAPTENPFVLAAFPVGVSTFEVTWGGCSCDLCGVASEPGDATAERDALRARYRAKHPRWSAAKITRAVEAARLPSDAARSRGSKAIAFCNTVAELAVQIGVVHVFQHWYSGDVRTEEIAVCASRRSSVADYARAGGALPIDTVVAIER